MIDFVLTVYLSCVIFLNYQSNIVFNYCTSLEFDDRVFSTYAINVASMRISVTFVKEKLIKLALVVTLVVGVTQLKFSHYWKEQFYYCISGIVRILIDHFAK